MLINEYADNSKLRMAREFSLKSQLLPKSNVVRYDFVACADQKPPIFIEIDDPSHMIKQVCAKDEVKNNICKEYDFIIKRISIRTSFRNCTIDIINEKWIEFKDIINVILK